jgi:hypothetical protein
VAGRRGKGNKEVVKKEGDEKLNNMGGRKCRWKTKKQEMRQ